jgi:SAM-dependent methyltransferase
MSMTVMASRATANGTETSAAALEGRVREYWNQHVHDANVSTSPPGTDRFFAELEAYRADKLSYLLTAVDFAAYAGQRVLEIGCGIGLDLVRLARAGALPVGVDVSETAVRLAAGRESGVGSAPAVRVADGATLPFPDESLDVVYSHGGLPYVADSNAVIRESHRVLRRGGEAIFMAYHQRSWLNAMRQLGRVRLAHSDAPVLRIESLAAFRESLAGFELCTIVPERFPVPTRIHGGWKAATFNQLVIPLWRLVPRSFVKPFGWHLLAYCRKAA